MAHPAQRKFCKSVKKKFPNYFKNVYVADIGSLDINGTNKYLFKGWGNNNSYIGVDIVQGPNVNIVMKGHKYLNSILEHYKKPVHRTIISTEALEHDDSFELTLQAMYDALQSKGLLIITCAGDGRPEHGTTEHAPTMSPGTNHYYKNISNEMFSKILKPDMFSVYHLEQVNMDLQFYGIKN